MKPRPLRQRIDKASKILQTIHKHAADADCRIDENRGENGHIIVDFAGSGISRRKIVALGRDLESKGYAFNRKERPWLGQVTYQGEADDRPTVVISRASMQDRLAIAEESPPEPYSFKDERD